MGNYTGRDLTPEALYVKPKLNLLSLWHARLLMNMNNLIR